MIQVKLTPHRGYLRAAPEGSQETQKLFLLAQLTPQAGTARAPVALTFVVDTSGSMREKVQGGRNKLELVTQALSNLLQSPDLDDRDQLSIVRFDDDASTVTPLTNNRAQVARGIEDLRKYSGGTMMGLGMLEALSNSVGQNTQANRRVMLLTDGATFD